MIRVVLVAGVARDGTIGRGGGIPWRYTEDMRHFRRCTADTALVMGRKTYDSIGRPLPERDNIVVTRDPPSLESRAPGVFAAGSVEQALEIARGRGATTVSVIGGAEIYRLALPLADELLLTYVPEDGGGDVFFPDWDAAEWSEVERETIDRIEVVRYRRGPV